MKRFIAFITFTIALIMMAECAAAKKADLAGTWYPDSPEALKKGIEAYLENAYVGDIGGSIVGVIAPHAGLRFSGAIAAYTYKALAYQNPSKVIIVGFSHKFYFPGHIAVFNEHSFDTPLGTVPIDMDISRKLIAYDAKIKEMPKAFIAENSIELQIPFVQLTLKDANLVLIVLCDQDKNVCKLLVDALSNVLQEEEDFVIVASSDMCHYLPYYEAERKDKATIEAIKTFEPELFYLNSKKKQHTLMCGYGAVYSVMEASKKLGADKSIILKYANSGDFAVQTKDSVVGYLSALFVRTRKPEDIAIARKGSEEAVLADKTGTIDSSMRHDSQLTGYDKKEERGMFNKAQKKKLLEVARNSIKHQLETGRRLDVEVDDEMFKQYMGAFVTLHKDGQLRGCIGHIIATGPLYLTVRDMAVAAAVQDPRFVPVTLNELDDIDIEISVLSPMKRVDDYNEIVMGRHGVMVKKGLRSGVYLPQVADETAWDRERFMNSLCANKAGISPDAWKTGECEIYVFTAEVFGEKDK